MSCKAYDSVPKEIDEELRRTNDIREMNNLFVPNKQIRYVVPIKL